MELILWSAISMVFSITLNTLGTFFRELKEEEISHWLIAYWEAECGTERRNWASDSSRFWKEGNSNSLMNYYYRGFLNQVTKAFCNEDNLRRTLQDHRTDWMLSAIENATNACQASLDSIAQDQFDSEKGHRLYAFPILIALQFLPHADISTGNALSYEVGKLLTETQKDAGHYTESSRDQINQIISQILTEQLRVRSISWNNMVVTRDVIDPLIDLGRNPESISRFETALGLSLQFLVYYRVSLESLEKRKRYSALCQEQAALID